MADKSEKMKARLPRGFVDRSADDIRAVEKMMAKIREVYELYGFEPVETPLIEYTDALGKFLPDQDRPERGRVLLPGRRRAVAVAALRPDRAAGPLRRRELRAAAQALPQLSLGLGVPQREARPGPLPPVHAVRRRHGRHAGRRGRRRDVHDDGRHDGSARHQARRLRHPRQQPQGARRRARGDRPRRRRECRPPADRAARHRQARQVRPRGRAAAARRGPLGRRQGRRGRFHQGRRAGRRRRSSKVLLLDRHQGL